MIFLKIKNFSTVIFFILTFRYINARGRAESRIVGGSDAKIRSFGYQVSIELGPYLCGGALIKDDWVCTAAHCTKAVEIPDMLVRLGSKYFTQGGIALKVVEKIVHEDFDKTGNFENDISLLRLAKNVTQDQKVKFGIKLIPLCTKWPNAGESVWVTGFGAIYVNGPLSRQLKKVTVKTISKRNCLKDYGRKELLTSSMECAGLPNGGKDSCEGDSGGPLVYKGKLCGVVSWGFGCASADYPGIYTSVPYMSGWISEHIDKNSTEL